MVVDVVTETLIQRQPAEVASFAADPSNAPRWYQNITAVRWETEPPLRIGSRVAFEARFLGRVLRYTYEIVEYDSGGKLVMRTAQGPFPMETTYSWRPAPDGGTTMTLRNCGEPSGFSRLASPMLASAMRRANRADLARIKEILERP